MTLLEEKSQLFPKDIHFFGDMPSFSSTENFFGDLATFSSPKQSQH
jgi:hypothetical protein